MAEPIDGQYKAFPVADQPVRIGDAGEQGWNALQPPFSTPVMVLKDRALQHNIDLMADYCSARAVSLAPHTKTPLSPQIAARQLAAGAWALTVADVHQARVLRSAGAQRLFVANEVTDAASAAWLARELDRDPGLEMYCLVDSWAGAALLDRHLADAGFRGRLPVLIELGIPGARCGCRSVAEAVDLAARVAPLPHLRIAGAEAYENLFPPGTAEQTIGQVDQLLDACVTWSPHSTARACSARQRRSWSVPGAACGSTGSRRSSPDRGRCPARSVPWSGPGPTSPMTSRTTSSSRRWPPGRAARRGSSRPSNCGPRSFPGPSPGWRSSTSASAMPDTTRDSRFLSPLARPAGG